MSSPSLSLSLRSVAPAEIDLALAAILEFNAHETIDTPIERIRPGLERLLRTPDLGQMWWIADAASPTPDATLGYSILTFGFDLEYGGRDAWVTDLYIQPEFRGRGIGRQAFALVEAEARRCGAGALHLVVRRENEAAIRAYTKNGMRENPRMEMIKIL